MVVWLRAKSGINLFQRPNRDTFDNQNPSIYDENYNIDKLAEKALKYINKQ